MGAGEGAGAGERTTRGAEATHRIAQQKQETGSAETPRQLRVIGLRIEDEVRPGADLAGLLLAALAGHGETLLSSDILVVAQKVVSKAEGRLVPLAEVEPSALAVEIARSGPPRDPRAIEVVLRETRRIVRMDRGILITETHQGYVCANAGVDLSHVAGGEVACLLPLDPDRSAAMLRERLLDLAGVGVGVIVTDTFGRPWRTGLTNVALGLAGLAPLRSYAGRRDEYGYELRVTEMAVADELAAAAELVMGKTDRRPFALIRGYPPDAGRGSGRELLRDAASDLFR